MSTSTCLYRMVAAAALVLLARTGATQDVSREQAPAEFGREYSGVIQQALDSIVVPRLTQVLSSEERDTLGTLIVQVVPAMDPLKIKLEPKWANSSRLVVSVGYLIIQDVLIDASLLSMVAGEEERLVMYSIDVAKLAQTDGRDAPSPSSSRRLPPRPFWEVLGWSEQQYESVRQNSSYKRLDARVRVETLAWIVAYALEKRLDEAAVHRDKSKVANKEERIVKRTADLLTKARFAPVPALGVSIYYFGAEQPGDAAAATWVCNARDVLMAAIVNGERGSGRASIDPTTDSGFVRWRQLAGMLDRKGRCSA